MADSWEPEAPAPASFATALERTREALTKLAQHWQEGSPKLVAALRELLDDPEGLSQECHDWAQHVGLAYVVPKGALPCVPLPASSGRDGLRPSEAGGPGPRTHANLLVAPAPPCGLGVFATAAISKGTVLGEYTGEVRNYELWCKEIKALKVAARGEVPDVDVPFIPEELYSAWAGPGPEGAGVVIDAFARGNAMRFVNCSCSPNCTFKSFGTGAQSHHRLRVIATRDVAAWEQLSVDYGWYYDEATRQDLRRQAWLAYGRDIAGLGRLAELMKAEDAAAWAAEAVACEASEPLTALHRVLQEAAGPPAQSGTAPFLSRYVEAAALTRLLEKYSPQAVPGWRDIPDAVWPLYEVAAASAVGIPCRCALEPSLNRGGRCSGIIGRPLQEHSDGRD